jgi:hypothetical protein
MAYGKHAVTTRKAYKGSLRFSAGPGRWLRGWSGAVFMQAGLRPTCKQQESLYIAFQESLILFYIAYHYPISGPAKKTGKPRFLHDLFHI